MISSASFYDKEINSCLKCSYDSLDVRRVPMYHLLEKEKEYQDL